MEHGQAVHLLANVSHCYICSHFIVTLCCLLSTLQLLLPILPQSIVVTQEHQPMASESVQTSLLEVLCVTGAKQDSACLDVLREFVKRVENGAIACLTVSVKEVTLLDDKCPFN